MPQPRAKKTGRTQTFLAILIPVFFLAVAGYQVVVDHKIDKYVVGVLMVFGLGAAGWRVDLLLEKYLEARLGAGLDQGAEEEQP